MTTLNFDVYKSLSIYMHDFEHENVTHITLEELGFDCVNPPIRVKILPNGAVDIVNKTGEFISDIKLSPQQKKYIANINERKCDVKCKFSIFPPSTLLGDYEEDELWALTSKMRNYTIGFKLASGCKDIRDWMAKRLVKPLVHLTGEEYSSEYHDEEHDELSSLSSGVVDDGEEDNDNLDADNTVDQLDDGIQVNENNDSEEAAIIIIGNVEGGGKVAHSNIPVPIKDMFDKVVTETSKRPHNCLVFEYFYDKCNYCTAKMIAFPDVILLEMFIKHHHVDDGSETTPTVHVLTAILFHCINCDGVDKAVHSGDEEWFSGVNFYTDAEGSTKGVVFGGPQIADSNDYGSIISQCQIVPDLLLTNEAIVNMDNYKVPKTSDEEKFWYDYEAHKEPFKCLFSADTKRHLT